MRALRTYHVTHFGPDPTYVGGMGSVLRMMQEHQIGGRVNICPTWEPTPRWPLVFARALWTLIRIPRGTIIHVHVAQRGSLFRKTIVLGVARARRVNCVATIHGSDFPRDVQRRPRAVRRLLQAAQVVVCLTEEAAGLCRQLSPATRVVVIPNPARIGAEFTPVDQTAPIALFAGEVGRRKGVDVLAAAWKTVSAHIPEARCVVLGPIADVDSGPGNALELLGPVSPDHVARWLSKSRVVVLPSRAEAMPMILLEAMGSGRPFVATPVGRVAELAKHGGFLVPVGDAEQLAEALINLLSNAALAKQVGDEGFQHCIENWSPTVIAKRLSAVYQQLDESPLPS